MSRAALVPPAGSGQNRNMDALGRFAFVLVRPQSPGNVGAAARALKNMGFADLRLVAPESYDARAARAMAVHADDVLAAATIWPDLHKALADRTLVVGTTARVGPYRAEARAPRDVAQEMTVLSGENRVAVVFGPEDCGLSNQDLKLCQRLITIPAAAEYASLNLAQAVLLIAYELRKAAHAHPTPMAGPQFVTSADLDAMLMRLEQALITIGFIPEDLPDHIMFAFRALLGRGGVLPRELEILNGLARQIRWFGEGGYATLATKRQAGRPPR
jgi:tRNA/rRNA methyltransferase